MVKKKSGWNLIFDICNHVFFALVIMCCILPVWHVFCASFSDAGWVMGKSGLITYIKGFNIEGYKLVFASKDIWIGYLNTFIYVVAGTSLGMILTILTAYVVSRKELLWANTIMFFISLTMLFNGGLIANYILVTKGLNLYDSRLAIIIPGCMNAFNLILVRTAMTTVPKSLEESAMLDGASRMTVLLKIVLPLIKATLATVILYYVVAHWNSWFQASIYLKDRAKFPLQLILKEILISNDMTSTGTVSGSEATQSLMYKQLIKYCTIMVSTVPIFIFYPFIQKNFEKGVMIGAIKG